MLSAKTSVRSATSRTPAPRGYVRRLRFVTYLAPKLFPFYEFVADYVGRRLGCRTQLTVGAAYEAMAEVADVAFVCGLPYVELTRRPGPQMKPIAAPVLLGDRYRGKPIYFSDVVVRHGAPIRCWEDLRGRSWAFNETHSQSGYGVTRDRLLRTGATGGFFSRVVEAGGHEHAVRLVCEGEVDASAIDSQLFAVLVAEQPSLRRQLRVIDSLGPSMIQPVVVQRRLPGIWKARIRAALLTMANDPHARPRLLHAQVARFTSVTDADYDDIRRMLAAAEAAQFMTIR